MSNCFEIVPVGFQQQERGWRRRYDIRGHRGTPGNGRQTAEANTSNHIPNGERKRLYVVTPILCMLFGDYTSAHRSQIREEAEKGKEFQSTREQTK